MACGILQAMSYRKMAAFLGFQIVFPVGVKSKNHFVVIVTVFFDFSGNMPFQLRCPGKPEGTGHKVILIIHNY